MAVNVTAAKFCCGQPAMVKKLYVCPMPNAFSNALLHHTGVAVPAALRRPAMQLLNPFLAIPCLQSAEEVQAQWQATREQLAQGMKRQERAVVKQTQAKKPRR